MRYLRFAQLLAISAMLLFCASVLDLPSLAAGRGTGAGAHMHVGKDPQQAGGALPLAVDGSRTPERIPDDVAYRLFLTAMALRPAALPDRFAARDGILKRAGLSSEDRAAFVHGLGDLAQQLDELSRQRNQFGPNSDPTDARAKHLALKAQEGERVLDARARVERLMSADGRARLDEHIRSDVKSRVKIYGEFVQ